MPTACEILMNSLRSAVVQLSVTWASQMLCACGIGLGRGLGLARRRRHEQNRIVPGVRRPCCGDAAMLELCVAQGIPRWDSPQLDCDHVAFARALRLGAVGCRIDQESWE